MRRRSLFGGSNSSKLDATAPIFGGPMSKWISMAAAVSLFPSDAMAAKEKTLAKKSEDRRRQRAAAAQRKKDNQPPAKGRPPLAFFIAM
jgi:hypothetical protein